MSDRYVRGHYVLGIQGLALLRRPQAAAARLREIEEIIDRRGYLAAFAAAGLTARRLIEPALTREDARARSTTGHPDAFEDALTGLPAVIVWEAERSGVRGARRSPGRLAP